MQRDMSRLLRPTSIAVIGGGAWCVAVISQLKKFGFPGPIWPVHPSRTDVAGVPAFPSLADLPSPPDASFIGINREATVGMVAQLAAQGAGGAVCFASGFAEVEGGADLNRDLLEAAGDMPILGPNCYGLINALDGALLWPDQHGCMPVTSGVAILTQSSNIAINLTMQGRGLPLAYVLTCGNQAQISQAEAAVGLLDDPRVTAIGLHVEGFGDLAKWQALARKARDKSVPLVVLKVGRSIEAQAATISHTASLAGGDAGAQALLDRLGIPRVNDLATLVETLKLLHVEGTLASSDIASISCSGGEASLAADIGGQMGLHFPPLNQTQHSALFAALGPKVTLANPLDYHTYIWRDEAAMTDAFAAMADPAVQLTCLIVDFPRSDRCDPVDWDHVVAAALATRKRTGRPTAMVASLPELLPESVAATLMAGQVVPMNGLTESFAAISAAIVHQCPDLDVDLLVPGPERASMTLSEAEAKTALSAFGLAVPTRQQAGSIDVVVAAAGLIPAPFVLKGEGLAHKSEAGAVVLGLTNPQAASDAAKGMQAQSFLLEEMITGAVAELLVGVVRDPAHGFVLTVAAGGTLTEILQDSASVLVPASRAALIEALGRLRIAPLFAGFRGKPAADMEAILTAIDAIQSYVLANADRLAEVEVNPILCTPTRAVAVDALIRIAP